MLFASKKDGQKAICLHSASLLRRQPIENSTQSSRYGLRSYTKTHVGGEVDHARAQNDPGVLVDGRLQTYQDSDLHLGNQEFAFTSPPSTQCSQDEEAGRRALSQTESPLDEQPPLWNSSKLDSYLKPDKYSDFDSFSTPPPPTDLEALRKTWEQVRVHHTNVSKVSAQVNTSIPYHELTKSFSL